MSGVINRQARPTPMAFRNAVSRWRGAATGLLLALGGLPAFAIPAVQAGDTLTATGARLAPVVAAPGINDIRRSVDLQGDQPSISFVTARTAGGALLIRTRNGYFLPWSGRDEDLTDCGFAPANGTLEFKILKQDLADMLMPVTVTVGYRTAGGVKFGTFEIGAK